MRSELIGMAAIAGCVSYPWLADGWRRLRTRRRRVETVEWRFPGGDR